MLKFPIIHSEIDLSLTRDWFFYCESSKKNTVKEKRCLELFKKVRSLLNKVTSRNVEDLAVQFEQLPVNNAIELYAIACLLHDKAVDEECYSEPYARVCKILCLQFIARPKSVKYPENISFQELVISCCQNFFEANLRVRDFGDAVLNMVFYDAMDPELLTPEEEPAIQRIRAIGNAKFVGELYNVDLLSKGIIHRCNIYLLHRTDELSMECLCRLIATIGKKLQNECDELTMNSDYYFLQYFNKMKHTLASNDFSSRVKYMVQDLIDLAKNNWVPRRTEAGDDGDDSDEDDEDQVFPKRRTVRCYVPNDTSNSALSELTVKKLMASDHDQWPAMADLKVAKDLVKCAFHLHGQAMLSLSKLREENLLCDATIQLDDGSVFHIHRAILSACSMYFHALFTTTLQPIGHTDFRLPNLAADTMNAILDYAYLRNVNIGPHNAVRLLIAADYLAMEGLMELCCEYMRKQLSPLNCIGIMRFSQIFLDAQIVRLAADAHRYVMRHFIAVATESTELLELPLAEMAALLGSDTLNAKSEEPVWECVLRWIGHNPDQRKPYIKELLGNIRLGLLDTQYFLEKVKDHPWVLAQDECRPIIIETLKFLYNLEMITQNNHEIPTPEIARPRVPHEVMFAIGGWSGGSPTNFIETYDTRADRWVRVDAVDPAGPRAYHGTAVLGYKIYVIGGFDGIEYFNSCRCFDAESKTWKEVAPMNNCRCYVSVAVLGELIFAMGGYDGHHRQNTAEKFNHASNQWSVIAPMHMQRSDASATMLNGRIYITGGFNGQECMNTAEVYDPETNQWTMIAQMRSRRSGVSCIAYHKHVYVIGGFNGISRMCSGERYNPATNTWSPIPDMYNPRSNFAIEVIDDMIFSIGGFNGVTTIYHVECYDEKTNEWYEATDMNMYRSALSACVIMGLPNINDYIHKHRERLLEEKRQRRLLPDTE